MTNVEFYGKNIDLDKTGIILVDMQSLFLEHYSNEDIDFMCKAQKDILEVAVNQDYPLAILETLCDEEKTNYRLNNLIRRIQRKEYFQKRDMDGFINEQFYPWLKNMNLENLCFMGVHTNQCVLETAKSAKDYGFNILLARQLTKGFVSSEFNLLKSINWFRHNGIYTTNYKEIVDLLKNK